MMASFYPTQPFPEIMTPELEWTKRDTPHCTNFFCSCDWNDCLLPSFAVSFIQKKGIYHPEHQNHTDVWTRRLYHTEWKLKQATRAAEWQSLLLMPEKEGKSICFCLFSI